LDDPEEFVLVEAFRDDDKAGAAHVGSEHFKVAMETFPQALVATPKIISQSIPQDDWDTLAEMTV